MENYRESTNCEIIHSAERIDTTFQENQKKKQTEKFAYKK